MNAQSALQRCGRGATPSALQTAIHVAFDPFMPERLAHLGAINVVRASDCLLVGPSRRDPRKHEQAREVWWDTSEKWDHLYSPAVRWDRPVVLWVSANIGERIHLWRACSWLRRMRIPARDIFPLELDVVPPRRPPVEPTPPFNCTASVADDDRVRLKQVDWAHAIRDASRFVSLPR